MRQILRRHGIPPAPDRGLADRAPGLTAATSESTLAIDFITVPVGPEGAAHPWHILVEIHIPTRTAVILGVTDHPAAPWMAQVARNLTMTDVGPVATLGVTRIRIDHDIKFTLDFQRRLSAAGLAIERTAIRCPWQNWHIERWFRTVKTSFLRKAHWADPGALHEALAAFVNHYNRERPHHALDNRQPTTAAPPQETNPATIQRLDRMRGLLSVYRAAAA